MFLAYLQALYGHLVWFLGAVPFFIDRVFSLLWPAYRKFLDRWRWRQQFWIWVFVVCAFVASFLAWRDEYLRANALVRPPLDPLYLYQGGYPVAQVQNPSAADNGQAFVFGRVTANRPIDLSKMFEYQDWKLLCAGREGSSMVFGAVHFYDYPQMNCRVQGAR